MGITAWCLLGSSSIALTGGLVGVPADDKTIRVWEFGIPVQVQYIADPSMHAISATTLSPNGECGGGVGGKGGAGCWGVGMRMLLTAAFWRCSL